MTLKSSIKERAKLRDSDKPNCVSVMGRIDKKKKLQADKLMKKHRKAGQRVSWQILIEAVLDSYLSGGIVS